MQTFPPDHAPPRNRTNNVCASYHWSMRHALVVCLLPGGGGGLEESFFSTSALALAVDGCRVVTDRR